MTLSAPRLAVLAGIALPLAIAGASFAQGQFSGPPPGPPGSNGAPPNRPPMSQAEYMRQTLGLTPAQEPALQTFLAAVAAPPGLQAHIQAQDAQMNAVPTPQRLDMMLSRMDEARSLMVTRIQATKRFYSELSPAQQRTFDSLGSQGGPPR